MQLASYGTRALPGRFLARLLPRNPTGTTSRGIHIGPLPHTVSTGSAGVNAQKIVQQTRDVLGRFLAHLTAPGLRAPSSAFPVTARSLHTGTRSGIQGIRSNLSLPVRHALSRGPFLPHAPMVPRMVTQVGLGTARNFSSTRPIFQNLAQNVPVAGRAFWEADWEALKMRDECRVKMNKENGIKGHQQSKEMIKPTKASFPLFAQVESEASDSVSEAASDLEHYFPTVNPPSTGLTTHLLIPLAPTPTSRLPLSPSPLSPTTRRETERLLPLTQLASLHTSHSTHGLRVSSLFARLDAANIWDKGVACDAYSSEAHWYKPGESVCTILRVSFIGWSAAEVRGVIGESGSGWCELYEARSPLSSASSSASMSDMSSEDGMSEMDAFDDAEWASLHGEEVDPSTSCVLPTLDFSASFCASSSGPAPAMSRAPSDADIDMLSNTSSSLAFGSESDSDSDLSSESGVSSTFSFHNSDSSSDSWVQPTWQGSSSFRFGFSSEFVGRLGSEGSNPREVMF